MKQTPIHAFGLPWYEEQDFAQIKALMEDGDRLHRTYPEWKTAAEQVEQKLGSDGRLVVRAVLKPDAFREFCRARNLRLDANGRNQFASFVAAQEYRARG